MESAIEVAIAAFGAVLALVLIFAAVLGLRSSIETRRRRKARAKEEAEAWTKLLTSQIAIAPVQVADPEAGAALVRARKLHHNAGVALKTAKKTKQFERIRTYALAGLHNLNVMRRRLGKAPGPQGPMPFNSPGAGARNGRDDNIRDVPTGPATGLPF
ncbi:hypothetical protein [Glycomyces buryatensis]|uniref:Uncharacterized protein n=1 Tax=Glycomyces buryatensis TaxID=2570927 RepID=A0A4S8QG25_9ACTN|nr:hypothetical protein [Glycomyces buryatensis]THV42102.1 hypothetical protein FAB82_07605 [Glycomyces buryatensis]